MRRFRSLAPLVLLLAACKSGDGTGLEGVAKIVVTPGQALLTAAGSTQQFTAQAMDGGGGAVGGVVVSWRSTNSAIVKVDATGLATAVAEGSAAVVAESGSASGRADVVVDVPDCLSPQTVSIARGGVFVSDPPASASCALTLPSGSLGDRYRVAIVRLGSAQDAAQVPVATLRLTARGVVATAAPAEAREAALPALFDDRQMEMMERSERMSRATEAVHARLRDAEATLLRGLTAFERIAPRAIAIERDPQAVSPAKRTFIPRLPTDVLCAPAKAAVTGVLVAQTAEAAVYQDSAQAQSQPLSVASTQKMLDFFKRYGKTTIESYFGAIPDRDGNGQVVILATPEVANPVAAFVWGGDQLPKNACAASNEMELVYFNPTLINDVATGNYQAIETLVHEVKHVVSFNQRVVGTVFATQPTWVEEGTAEIAGEAASRRGWAATGGPAHNGVVNAQSLRANGGAFTPENYGIVIRLTRVIKYLAAQPNAVVIATSQAYSVYGSGWHFHRFLGDGYGGAASSPGADAGLFKQQNVSSTPPGLAGFLVFTQKTYEEILVDYAAAIMLNGTGTPIAATLPAFRTYDFPSATSVFSGIPAAPYPYPVTAVGQNPSASFSSGIWSGPIGNGGVRIHDFVSNGTGTGTEITVQVEPPARVVVVRLR
ncbi:MAG: hypothetical protein EXR95_06800 [Gemmatimonadetes bacterium]|nr:hypothetical protein [Gemmatimonadota bacterium]